MRHGKLLMQALLDPGDEVILFEPCWLNYRDMILLCEGVPRFIPFQKGLFPDLSELEGRINSKKADGLKSTFCGRVSIVYVIFWK